MKFHFSLSSAVAAPQQMESGKRKREENRFNKKIVDTYLNSSLKPVLVCAPQSSEMSSTEEKKIFNDFFLLSSCSRHFRNEKFHKRDWLECWIIQIRRDGISKESGYVRHLLWSREIEKLSSWRKAKKIRRTKKIFFQWTCSFFEHLFFYFFMQFTRAIHCWISFDLFLIFIFLWLLLSSRAELRAPGALREWHEICNLAVSLHVETDTQPTVEVWEFEKNK